MLQNAKLLDLSQSSKIAQYTSQNLHEQNPLTLD